MIPVCVFAKPPLPGKVKTRLIPVVSAEAAAALASAMLLDTWRIVNACRGARAILAAAEEGGFPLQVADGDLFLQPPGDLGFRIETVLRRALASAPAVIALGADSPFVTATILAAAIQALEDNEAVIGRTGDGGFYLLGLRQCPPGLFEGVPWSTSETAAVVVERLSGRNWKIAEAPVLFDVDVPADLTVLAKYAAEGGGEGPCTREWLRLNRTPGNRVMLISIIVPALNEGAHISSTIRALQHLAGEKEILIVDGGSTDDTVALAHSADVPVIESAPGRGQQMRAGAEAARGEILWFVHADTLPPPDALPAIRRAVHEDGALAGNFNLVFDGGSRAARQMTAIYPWLRSLRLSYGDSALFVRRDIYERIGGFRPFPLFEDLDLLKRLRRAGRFVHLPQRMITSSRRFEDRNFALMWAHWTTLQVLYWCGVSPERLARHYAQVRRQKE